MKKKSFFKILQHRAEVRKLRYLSEKNPEKHLHGKSLPEMSMWEKRIFCGKNGKPVPICSFVGRNLVSHKECEKILDRALKLTLLERVQRFFDF